MSPGISDAQRSIFVAALQTIQDSANEIQIALLDVEDEATRDVCQRVVHILWAVDYATEHEVLPDITDHVNKIQTKLAPLGYSNGAMELYKHTLAILKEWKAIKSAGFPSTPRVKQATWDGVQAGENDNIGYEASSPVVATPHQIGFVDLPGDDEAETPDKYEPIPSVDDTKPSGSAEQDEHDGLPRYGPEVKPEEADSVDLSRINNEEPPSGRIQKGGSTSVGSQHSVEVELGVQQAGVEVAAAANNVSWTTVNQAVPSGIPTPEEDTLQKSGSKRVAESPIEPESANAKRRNHHTRPAFTYIQATVQALKSLELGSWVDMKTICTLVEPLFEERGMDFIKTSLITKLREEVCSLMETPLDTANVPQGNRPNGRIERNVEVKDSKKSITIRLGQNRVDAA